MNPMSLTAYAKRRGVSAVAVSKAVASGRLSESVVRIDGAPKIADADLADREWDANTRPRIDRPPPALAAPRPATEAAPTAPLPQVARSAPTSVPDYNVSRALREAAAARREAALAESAEMDLAERKGELVPVDDARADMIDRFTVVKTRILGVPSRVAQRLPHLAAELVPVIEALLREALEEIAADAGEADHDEE